MPDPAEDQGASDLLRSFNDLPGVAHKRHGKRIVGRALIALAPVKVEGAIIQLQHQGGDDGSSI
jgi:hypothetical protein